MNTLFNGGWSLQIYGYTIQLWIEYSSLCIHYSIMDRVFKFMNTLIKRILILMISFYVQGNHTGKKHELLLKILPLSGKSYFLESAHWTCTQMQIYCLFLSNAYINCYMYMYILKNWSLVIIRHYSFSDFVLHVQHTWNFYRSLATFNNGKLIWYFKTSWYAILLYTKVWFKNLCTNYFQFQ